MTDRAHDIETSSESRDLVTAFARGLAVIEALGPENRTRTVAEVAARTGVDRAVARRLCSRWSNSALPYRVL